MGRPAYAIPEKLFFKIGEVCELTDIQAHVLRYWESEFPMLAPQKNPAGQRTYRKRDVEIVVRIKELLYDEQYTIAGAKKKLASELRGASKLRVVAPAETPAPVEPKQIAPPVMVSSAPPRTTLPPVRAMAVEEEVYRTPAPTAYSATQVRAVREIAQQLQDLLVLLDHDVTPEPPPRRR